MNKRNLLNMIIFFLAVTTFTANTYAEEVEQTIQLSVQPFVSVQKDSNSTETGKVNPATGVHGGLHTIYDIHTNGTDSDYDFTVTSTIMTEGGEVSAYGNNGILLFGHTLAYPLQDAITNAKAGGNNNKNVIAYPTSTTITSPMTSTYTTSENGYVIKTNDATDGTFTHNVSGTPVSGTYNVAQDEAGTYQATIILTVKPKN